MSKIRLGIVGYGNVGRGVECAIAQNSDMELVAIFTRRNPAEIVPTTAGVKVFDIAEAESHSVDVMLLCGGSANDLIEQTPRFAAMFNCVDSFDTHAKIPEYFAAVDECAKKAKKVSIISTGWDPGLFSLIRVLGMACLPFGCGYTFWGKGVSQGHSNAIRSVKDVKYAVQYTVPKADALAEVRKGGNPTLIKRQKHTRECFVVAEPHADTHLIEQTIVTMPDYFRDDETLVHFISEEEFHAAHTDMPHGGFVFRTGATGGQGTLGEKGEGSGHKQRMEFSLQLDNNPGFTASVMLAYARAAHRLSLKGEVGARTVLDIPLGLLTQDSMEELRRTVL